MGKVMIGTDHGSYTFDASGWVVSINSENYKVIKPEGLLLITHIPSGTIIYNFANPSLLGALNNYDNAAEYPSLIVNLDYDTSAFSDDDPLQIWCYIDDDDLKADDTRIHSSVSRMLLQTIASNQTAVDNIGRTRVILEGTNNINAVSSVGSLGSVTTVSTVTTLNNLGSYNATPVVPYTTQMPIEVQMQKIVVT